MDRLDLATRIEAYDPRLSPDNRADELELHRDVVLATGIGMMNPEFEATFLRSLDAAMQLVPEGWRPVIDLASEEGAALVDLWALPVATPKPERRHAKAATPALALTAACLRAISQKGDG